MIITIALLALIVGLISESLIIAQQDTTTHNVSKRIRHRGPKEKFGNHIEITWKLYASDYDLFGGGNLKT